MGRTADMNSQEHLTARSRRRQGAVLVVDGVPVPNPRSTGNILVGSAIGVWLASHSREISGRLLDLGCGNRPYGPWYEPLVDEWLAVDPAPGANQTIQAMADAVPLRSESIDVVLCTEVLEHVDRSELAVAEIARVLRPGGSALITAPFIYPLHEAPYDFHRYTYIGLRSIVERNGLVVEDLGAQGGPLVLVASFAFRAARAAVDAVGTKLGLAEPLALKAPFRWLLIAPQQWAVNANPHRSFGLTARSRRLSNGYMVLARKPAQRCAGGAAGL